MIPTYPAARTHGILNKPNPLIIHPHDPRKSSSRSTLPKPRGPQDTYALNINKRASPPLPLPHFGTAKESSMLKASSHLHTLDVIINSKIERKGAKTDSSNVPETGIPGSVHVYWVPGYLSKQGLGPDRTDDGDRMGRGLVLVHSCTQPDLGRKEALLEGSREGIKKKKKKKCIYIQLSTPTSNSNFSGLKAQSTPTHWDPTLSSLPTARFKHMTITARYYTYLYLYLITTFFVTSQARVCTTSTLRYLDILARNILLPFPPCYSHSPNPTHIYSHLLPLTSTYQVLPPLYEENGIHKYKSRATPNQAGMNNARTHARTHARSKPPQSGTNQSVGFRDVPRRNNPTNRLSSVHAIASCVCVLEGASWRMDLGCSIQGISDHGEKPLGSRNNQPTNSFASTDEICAAIQIGLQCLDEVAMQIHRLGLYERQRT
ncbi:hypothetical protein NEUTE1DRAFT_109594 [Neurospora tetrasperma FGSC 2508]|uniref:Uncharacterized protein n=1 Tax=Neurospora tetrasperma (strain FGSC 2508 / ATCC MYA-4615 / P0657) TaxID=510951 RepID=F8MJZ2_NEUT8|nr:uncharacterized protein NEUTE1DRAFT_109594 [Neurospora tetrasperma FGSC 2508]EGO57329.1 hypothetical protein NEUTE1DRAFT_109594 [Neurospora tetrasperma FGSC 2508]EGZ72418.1 hypothetical protein NEUTE2DRAFT_63951 [Neurospora tetrasperma FGSC 2509]